MAEFEKREGEIALAKDPADFANDGKVVFIGNVRTAWKVRSDCPKNLVQAREKGVGASLQLDEMWRPGLAGLENSVYAIVLYWMDRARRDLIVQKPNHRPAPTGVFSLRSPVRPNPIALAVVKILGVDHEKGIVTIDAIDCLDGTPIVDIKPYMPRVDRVGEAEQPPI